jgi:hypothetical protein
LGGYGNHIPAGVCRVVDAADIEHLVDGCGSRQSGANHGVSGIPSDMVSLVHADGVNQNHPKLSIVLL